MTDKIKAHVLENCETLSGFDYIADVLDVKPMAATHVYHKIRFNGKRSKYSAWFNGDPRKDALAYVVDCERIDALGRSFPCTAAEREALLNGSWYSTHWHVF